MAIAGYNQDPALRGRFDVVWDNYAELDSDYDGIDVTVRKRLSNRWMLLGGMKRSIRTTTPKPFARSCRDDPLPHCRAQVRQHTIRGVSVSQTSECKFSVTSQAVHEFHHGLLGSVPSEGCP